MPGVDPIGNADYTYVQAANVIAARIEAGEFTRRLPAERDLAREMGVAYYGSRISCCELGGGACAVDVISLRHGRM